MLVAVWINCPDRATAEAIADALLQDRLVAATSIFPEIASRYLWHGRIRSAAETPLVVKTRLDLFDAVVGTVRALHPYQTPGIAAFEAARATDDYLAWLDDATDAC